jgi:hypothetical protein
MPTLIPTNQFAPKFSLASGLACGYCKAPAALRDDTCSRCKTKFVDDVDWYSRTEQPAGEKVARPESELPDANRKNPDKNINIVDLTGSDKECPFCHTKVPANATVCTGCQAYYQKNDGNLAFKILGYALILLAAALVISWVAYGSGFDFIWALLMGGLGWIFKSLSAPSSGTWLRRF